SAAHRHVDHALRPDRALQNLSGLRPRADGGGGLHVVDGRARRPAATRFAPTGLSLGWRVRRRRLAPRPAPSPPRWLGSAPGPRRAVLFALGARARSRLLGPEPDQ